MKNLTLYGKEYPCRMTMGAMRRFKQRTGREVSQMGDSPSLAVELLYCCVASACNADGVAMELDVEKFADGVDMATMQAFTEFISGGEESKKK